MAAGVELPDSGRVNGIVLDFPMTDSPSSSSSSPPKVPRRLRRRLMESKSPSTVEEIEAKLKEADLRRQQFHEWLSTKARPKPRSPSWSSSQEDDLGQRLEAKLYAAEQKRLSILTKAQMRLARMDELRQAAKIGVEKRFEKEREELGTKVESRVQQAEANRMLLLKAYRQRRAATKERMAQSLLRRMVQERKYKERVHAAICQKRAAAEKKRLGLLEAEKTRARARVLQVFHVAKSVYHQREIERRKMKDKLENRLQRAKRQRAEYLRQRGNMHSSVRIDWNQMQKHGDLLSRKLARCWRRFQRLRRTTFALAKAFAALEINEKSVKSLPFEQLALLIESAVTLQNAKALLDRLESRFKLSQIVTSTNNLSHLDNIGHLLKRVSSPNRRTTPSNASRSRAAKKVGSSRETTRSLAKLSRYPVRVVLCAYMILGHPDAVFSDQGEREIALAESAATFIKEFELLLKTILDGPTQNAHQELGPTLHGRRTFRSQMAAFDAAWCSYLYQFVVWKVKDAKSLEEDLVRAACQLELSMMQKCKLTSAGDNGGLTHDMRAIQKQVTEDQRLLRERVEHLSGSAGIEHMESALSDTRSRFFEAKENGSPLVSAIVHISSPRIPDSVTGPSSISLSDENSNVVKHNERSSHVVRSLFKNDVSSPSIEVGFSTPFSGAGDQLGSSGEKLITENELLVNEIVHEHSHAFADGLSGINEHQNGIKAKIKETMEKAFWDDIAESMKQDEPDYSRVVELLKEVRDELLEMAPKSWKPEIDEAIDLDIFTQVLMSGSPDMGYLGRILEFALATLQKLSAPSEDEEMKKNHLKLLKELWEISQDGDKSNASFIIAMIKGLRFVLEEIQALKREISRARIRMMEPLIKGPAGLEYLKKAFTNRYGSPSEAHTSLPQTVQWLLSVRDVADQEWVEHVDSSSALTTRHVSSSQGISPPNTLRTGGSIPMASNGRQLALLHPTSSNSAGYQQLECKGGRVDLLVRIALLKLVTGVQGIIQESLPETLRLNFPRLRSVQAHIQKIIVISTSMLVLRQTLLSENLVTSQTEMENMISKCFKLLTEILDKVEDVGIKEIVEAISGFSDDVDDLQIMGKLQATKEVMASLLGKSLLDGDPVFTKVSHSVYLAIRGVLLAGSGGRGRELAEMALKRVGATVLTERIIEAGEVLVIAVSVSGIVHGPWYSEIIENM